MSIYKDCSAEMLRYLNNAQTPEEKKVVLDQMDQMGIRGKFRQAVVLRMEHVNTGEVLGNFKAAGAAMGVSFKDAGTYLIYAVDMLVGRIRFTDIPPEYLPESMTEDDVPKGSAYSW